MDRAPAPGDHELLPAQLVTPRADERDRVLVEVGGQDPRNPLRGELARRLEVFRAMALLQDRGRVDDSALDVALDRAQLHWAAEAQRAVLVEPMHVDAPRCLRLDALVVAADVSALRDLLVEVVGAHRTPQLPKLGDAIEDRRWGREGPQRGQGVVRRLAVDDAERVGPLGLRQVETMAKPDPRDGVVWGGIPWAGNLEVLRRPGAHLQKTQEREPVVLVADLGVEGRDASGADGGPVGDRADQGPHALDAPEEVGAVVGRHAVGGLRELGGEASAIHRGRGGVLGAGADGQPGDCLLEVVARSHDDDLILERPVDPQLRQRPRQPHQHHVVAAARGDHRRARAPRDVGDGRRR